MPKQKTHKGTKKRFKVSAGGKVKYRKTGRGHLLSHKSGNKKRKLRTPRILGEVDARRIRDLLNE